MIENPRLKDRSHPDLESIQAILKQIEGALAVRRQKADHSAEQSTNRKILISAGISAGMCWIITIRWMMP